MSLYKNIATVDEALREITQGTYYSIEDVDRTLYFAKHADVIFHPGGMIEVTPTLGASMGRGSVVEHFWIPAKVDSPGRGGIPVAPVKILFQSSVQNISVESAEELKKLLQDFKETLIR